VFLGERTDVATYLSVFDVVAHTSNNEGCSNSLLEAMALGKPVVATDVGGNRELVQHGRTGLLVPPGDAEMVARAILSLINDAGLAGSLGMEARRQVIAEFDQESMVRNYQRLYAETLELKSVRSLQ
jgi:glycosyltransferase involved in cell wall biosynthesis